MVKMLIIAYQKTAMVIGMLITPVGKIRLLEKQTSFAVNLIYCGQVKHNYPSSHLQGRRE